MPCRLESWRHRSSVPKGAGEGSQPAQASGSPIRPDSEAKTATPAKTPDSYPPAGGTLERSDWTPTALAERQGTGRQVLGTSRKEEAVKNTLCRHSRWPQGGLGGQALR